MCELVEQIARMPTQNSTKGLSRDPVTGNNASHLDIGCCVGRVQLLIVWVAVFASIGHVLMMPQHLNYYCLFGRAGMYCAGTMLVLVGSETLVKSGVAPIGTLYLVRMA